MKKAIVKAIVITASVLACALVLSIVLVGVWISISVKNSRDSRELIAAIRNDDIVAAQQIIEKNPMCVNAPSSAGPTWIHILTEVGVEYPLNTACVCDDIEAVELLIDAGANVNGVKEFPWIVRTCPLMQVYEWKGENWYPISVMLIENGASLNYTWHYASDRVDVLSHIVLPRPFYLTPRPFTAEDEENINRAFRYALEHCDHSRVDWERTLQNCIRYNRKELVCLLLEEGYCEVNAISDGEAMLSTAAQYSTADMAELLLSYGADPSYVDNKGKTAYDYAIESGNEEIIRLLEEAEQQTVSE